MQVDPLVEGISDVLEGRPSQVGDQDMRAAIEEVNRRIQRRQQEEAGGQAAEGERFLEENSQRDEVKVTSSGLQYEVLQEGEGGESPTPDSRVKVHYHGTLVDGTVFDSSVRRGEPMELPVNGVIAGWTEALQMMQPGDKWKLYVPHDLGYGANGAGGVIPPYAALIFEVELLEVL